MNLPDTLAVQARPNVKTAQDALVRLIVNAARDKIVGEACIKLHFQYGDLKKIQTVVGPVTEAGT